jgi:hypothetical protein
LIININLEKLIQKYTNQPGDEGVFSVLNRALSAQVPLRHHIKKKRHAQLDFTYRVDIIVF